MKRSGKVVAVVVAVAAVGVMGLAGEGTVIDALEDASRLRPLGPKAKVESVEGKSGKAVKLSFADGCRGKFVTTRARGTPAWDKAGGLSFWVKGDGSDHLGGIEIIWNENYALRYAAAFPIDSTEWRKVVIPWRDLLPELARPGTKPIAADGGNAPAKISQVWFGKWYHWRDDAGHSYAIDDLRLEAAAELDGSRYRPTGRPLARLLSRLKAREPVTIVTMGDSLTDVRHWANRGVNWPTLLVKKLEKRFGGRVKLVNPAVGGTMLTHGLIGMARWTKSTPAPDLVTLWYGSNDWDNGMRGALFLSTCKDAIDRVRRATRGKADVLVMTTCPSLGRWDTMAELAEACRRAAREAGAGICDTCAAFHKVDVSGRGALYCRDKTHLGPAGHALVAETVLTAIERAGEPPIRRGPSEVQR